MLGGLNPYPQSSQYSPSDNLTPESHRGYTPVSRSEAAPKDKEGISPRVQSFPNQKTTKPDGSPRDEVELSREAQEVRKLQLRDREVRAHEAAHAAAGGAYAGSPTYTFERGADGRSYAVGGSVSIDTSPVKGDPQATLQKAEQVRAAALAPAQPSAQDMKVAQKAQTMAAKARLEMVQQYQSAEKSPQEILTQPSFMSGDDEQKGFSGNSQGQPSASSSIHVAGFSQLDIFS